MNPIAPLGLLGGLAFLYFSSKESKAATSPAGQFTPGERALTPYGAGTVNDEGNVELDNGGIVDPQTGKVLKPPLSPAVPQTVPVQYLPGTAPPSPGQPAPPGTIVNVPPTATSPGQPTGTTTVPSIPLSVIERVAVALATRNPAEMMAEAVKLRREGYEAQAVILEKAAASIPIPSLQPTVTPAIVVPGTVQPSASPPPLALPSALPTASSMYIVKKGDTPSSIARAYTGDPTQFRVLAAANPTIKSRILAGLIYTGESLILPATWGSASSAPSPQATIPVGMPYPSKVLAQETALHLKFATKGKEDQSLVKRYQADNQPDAGAVDGKYGPKTALTMIRYGLVPPTPFYWPADATTAKRNYKNQLLAEAQRDPVRAQEWSQAAAAVV